MCVSEPVFVQQTVVPGGTVTSGCSKRVVDDRNLRRAGRASRWRRRRWRGRWWRRRGWRAVVDEPEEGLSRPLVRNGHASDRPRGCCRSRLVGRTRRDREPVAVEHVAVGADAGAVDIRVARTAVLPRDDEVRPVEGRSGRRLAAGGGRDLDRGCVEDRPVLGNPPPQDVSGVRPRDEVVRPVEGDTRSAAGSCEQEGVPKRRAGVIEQAGVNAASLPDDQRGRGSGRHAWAIAIAVVDLDLLNQSTGGAYELTADPVVLDVVVQLPKGEIVNSVEGDVRAVRREPLPWAGGEGDSVRIEQNAALAHSSALDQPRLAADGLPYDEVIRPVEGNALRRTGSDRDPRAVEMRTKLVDPSAEDARAPFPPSREVVRSVEGDARTDLRGRGNVRDRVLGADRGRRRRRCAGDRHRRDHPGVRLAVIAKCPLGVERVSKGLALCHRPGFEEPFVVRADRVRSRVVVRPADRGPDRNGQRVGVVRKVDDADRRRARRTST